MTRVSLLPARPALPTHLPAAPAPLFLADPAGAKIILGASPGEDGLARPITPGAASLFGPRGACLAAAGGPLFVCDTGHHRLMAWREAPHVDETPADFLIGQPQFSLEGRNARGDMSACTMNVPTGVAANRDALAVADAWNHRVLLWHGLPSRANQPADVVLGQADFFAGLANRGRSLAGADTLNWCYGVALIHDMLVVADTGNRRVLVWRTLPQENGVPADLVLGQRDFSTRDENAGGDVSALGMRWPHGIASIGDSLLVSDAGSNRIMVWHKLPQANGAPCDAAIGQATLSGQDHNQGAYWPTSQSLNMPYGLCVCGGRLVVADTANSRLLGFDAAGIATDAVAHWLTGQKSFADKGDNRWRAAQRDSLCWPYGASAASDTLVISDSGNNRVLLWGAAP